MSQYTVVYHQLAEDQLLEIWLAAEDWEAVTSAMHAIEGDLANNAEEKGIGVEGDLRRLSIPPLSVLFDVRELDRLVRVIDISRS